MASKRTSTSSTPQTPRSTSRRSWVAFDRAAAHALGAFRAGAASAGARALKAAGIAVPDDLLRLAVSIDDGVRIDLSGLGGGSCQELFSVDGLIDANDREEGIFGSRVSAGEVPPGLVMFGYGMTQLIYDTTGALGDAGSIWSCEDHDVTAARRLADSLEGLLASAVAPVVADQEPPPPPKIKLMPTPASFAAPLDVPGLFSTQSQAPVGWFVDVGGTSTSLWFRGRERELFAFELTTQSWTPLTALPAGFDYAEGVRLSDGSALLFARDYPSPLRRCVRGDGLGPWSTAAPFPLGESSSLTGRGVLPDGRVLVAGAIADEATWQWDPHRDAWSPGPKLPEAAGFSQVMQASDGPHFLSLDGPRCRPRVFSFDDAGWRIGRSPEAASGFSVVALSDGRFALVLTELRDAACLVYDPTTRTTSPLPALPQTASTAAACELAAGIIGSVRTTPEGREFIAILDVMSDAWRAGPCLPAGFTVHHIATLEDRLFVFALELVPGSAWPKREVTVFTASVTAVLAAK
jgi:hypothetical protein